MGKISTIAAVDVGTASVKAMVVKHNSDKDGFDVLGRAEGISSGMKKGGVNDVERVAKVIKRVVADVEREAGVEIENVYANINGAHIFSTLSKGTITVSRDDQEITSDEIERAINEAKTFSIPNNKEIKEVYPRSYTIDDEKDIKNPIGLTGVRLTADIITVGIFVSYSRWLTEALGKANLGVVDLAIGPIVSAEAVLTTQEKELGVVAVDFGATTTGIAVYKDESLLFTKVIPVGVHNIRNDIATGLQVDIETAELIKKKYGNSIFGDKSTKKESIRVNGRGEISFQRNQLRKIMGDRISQIFTAVREEIETACPKQELPGGVVLTGGGAKIPHIKTFAQDKIKLSCRTGAPRRFFGMEDNPSYSTLCGLILYGADEEEDGESRFDFGGSFVRVKKILRHFLP